MGACPGYATGADTLMATKQQLKSQLDSLRSDNQRLEELVEDLRTANPERAQMAERARAYDEVLQQLEALQEENSALKQRLANDQTAGREAEIASLSTQLREAVQEAEATKERARTAEMEAEATKERARTAEMEAERMATIVEMTEERARMAEMEAERMATIVETTIYTKERTRKTEMEAERLAEVTATSEERAKLAETEVKRLTEELSHAELEQFRAVAAQQARWEAREQRLEAQLVLTERRLQAWERLGHTPEVQPGEMLLYRNDEGRKSPPPLVPHQMSGLPGEQELFPQTTARIPVTAPHQMSGLPGEQELFPQTTARIPVTAPHQMSGLPGEQELFPQTTARIPVTAPHQMSSLPGEQELFPHTTARIPVTVPHQMSGPPLRGLEQCTQMTAGGLVRVVPAQVSDRPQRGVKWYPHTPTGVPVTTLPHQTAVTTSSVPSTVIPTVTPSVRTSTTVPLSMTTIQPPNGPSGEQLDSQQKCELTTALGSLTQQLPSLPMFSGDDPARDSGTFQEWMEQFDMVAELALWSDGIKLRQLVLRLRGSARTYYRTLSEEQKRNYLTLVQELKNRFTPVRIQALESSIFRERRQKAGESVDAYAQDLQQLFQKAYPTALQGSEDAQMMGQSVLSNQLIAGLLPELKRKMAYLEGATFSELWQKARFEEARLLDLARTQPRPPAAPWKQRPPRDNSQRQEEQWKQRPPQDNLQRYERPPQNLAGGHAGDGQRRNLQFVRCYNCNKAGHLAKDCRSIRQMGEAPARTQNQSAPKTSNWNAGTRAAAVVSVQGEGQSHNEEEPLKWMYEMYGILQLDVPPHDTHLRLGPTLSLTVKLDGIPVEALIDTGCPATIISREICRKILDKEREEAQPLSLEQWKEKAAKRLKQPSLLLKAYCGTELSIGAEIAVQVATPHHAVNSIVLVQKDTPVHMLLGTDLMSALGIKVLDDDGRSLLVPDNEEPLPVQVMEQPLPVQVMEQPQPVQVMEQPLPVQVMEQPQPVEVVEQPQPVGVVEQTQPVGVVEQPQPVPVNRCPAHTEVQLESQQKPQRSTTIVLQPQQVDDTSSHDLKSLSPCLKIGKRRYPVHGFSDYGRDPESTHKTPDTEIDQKSLGARRIPVRLIQACKLPGRCGKLLKAKLKNTTSISSFEWLFEPKTGLHNNALEIADAIVKPEKECILLPVSNSSGSPTRLRRGQVLGWLQPADIINTEDNVTEMDEDPDDETVGGKDETPVNPLIETDGERDHEANVETEIQASGPVSTRVARLKAMLQLDQSEIDTQEQEALKAFLIENADVFALDNKELGRTDVVTHCIDTGDHKPIHQTPYRTPFALRGQVDKMVRDMLDQDVIQPTASPWASPIVLVKKKDGSMRFCVDYRRLNAITKLDVYPLPRIDDTLDVLAGARFFSTLDLASGYWQVTVDPAAREKTAFVTHAGLYEFKVMPFGLCNAPATFQRLMEIVLTGLTHNQCFVYLDDILIVSRSWDEHLENLNLVFNRLRNAGLRLKPKKCTFARRKALYLGHIISENGIEVDPDKVEKVREYPVPGNLKTLQQFLGLASYYRRFISNFSKIANPLHCLTRKDAPFIWSDSCQESFDMLKKMLTSTPVLTFPNFQQPFILETDASGLGLGAVLAQKQEDGSIHPIAYASRGLQKHERNYSVCELEALAVVWATKHFHVYLYGHHCTVFTDHCALKSLLNTPHPSGKLARWGLALQELDLDIQYRSGKLNTNADVLSRLPLPDQLATEYNPEALSLLVDHATTESDSKAPNHLMAKVEAEPVTEEAEAPPDNWQKLQRDDDAYAPTIAYLESNTLPPDSKLAKKLVLTTSQFSLLDGVLYHVQPDGRLMLAVPEALRYKLFKEAHGGVFSGHLREAKIYSQLRKHYWWPGMRSDVRKWCKACLVCATRQTGQATKPPLCPIPVAGPFDCVGVDVLQLPRTLNGNQYAVVFVDYLTKWPEVFATPDQTAETIANLFVGEIISRHGVPAKLLSDRGTNFLSELMQEICKLMGTKKVNTSSYHPQTDGLVERFNRTLTSMLAKTVEKDERNWDHRLPYVLFAYRTSLQESTRESPFHLLYGRDARLPTEAALSHPRTCYQVDLEDYKADLVANLSDAWGLAQDNVQRAQKRQKYQHDRRATSHKYQIGERVFVYQPSAAQGKARKFARPFHGPYRILELTPTNASVRPVDKPGEAPIFVSLDRVRRCPHEIPDQSWLGPAKRKSRTRKKRRRIEKPELPTISPEVSTQGAWSGRLRPRASEMQPREM